MTTLALNSVQLEAPALHLYEQIQQARTEGRTWLMLPNVDALTRIALTAMGVRFTAIGSSNHCKHIATFS